MQNSLGEPKVHNLMYLWTADMLGVAQLGVRESPKFTCWTSLGKTHFGMVKVYSNNEKHVQIRCLQFAYSFLQFG